ncbi:hypothetical protein ACFOY4_00265 [Actinomadura syzygii]|uniref:Uncharacterized protein n=1 Tax=Actinomadura syzygii TaxID=1427538 RepID=A0A5D0TP70_9ACTN|nr:hypothetical protein [Actinomadura syzygii]TYC08081.1 hypothetical protein FXF65_40145 [Actinomadura syzygii]
MGLLQRFRRRRTGQRAATRPVRARRRVPTFREMQAKMRTERAEARLMATEAKIHHEAEQHRRGGRHIQ